jgi:hypothetical protein
VDKVYQRKNLEMAWESVKANRGSGGVDGQSLEAFAAQLDQQLDRLQSELKEDTDRPQPVRRVQIPKVGKPGEFRMLGVPTIYDRVCQQALLNRLEPIFEPIFDEANFGYRRGRSTKDAMGTLLQACPRPNALQQTRPLDRATHLVASIPLLAQLWLETATEAQAVRRVWADTTGETDSFDCIAEERVFMKAWRGKTAHHV